MQHVFHIKKLSLMFKSQIRIPSGDKISKYSLQQSFFLHSTFLKEHMIDHTGERPYEGSHCNFNLWWSNNLVSLGDNSSIHQCEIMFTKTLWSSFIRLAKLFRNYISKYKSFQWFTWIFTPHNRECIIVINSRAF